MTNSDLQEKLQILENASLTLKAEFAGLNDVIDQLITNVKPWFLLPEALQKPSIVCLWGMTGVGKTSLILRLVELLDFSGRMVFEDLGKHTADNCPDIFQSNFYHANKQSIFVLDEVHTARTLDEFGNNIDRPHLRDFWTLLDHGLITRDQKSIHDSIMFLKDKLSYIQTSKKLTPEVEISSLFVKYDVDFILRGLTPGADVDIAYTECMENYEGWINKMIQIGKDILRQRPVLDFRKSLIFLSGNLDELYRCTDVVDSDSITADELHKFSMSITKSQIKQVLTTKFRAEQVARMGNSHILLPTLTEESFKKVIAKKLETHSQFTQEKFQIGLTFTESVISKIYKEGIIPTQGCRSLFSTISELIESRIPSWIIESMERKEAVKSLTVSFNPEANCFEVITKNGEKLSQFEHEVRSTFTLSEIDAVTKQIVAVHEAGHAVCGIVGLGILPVRIKIQTSIPSLHGFVQFPAYSIVNVNVRNAALAEILGGKVAEEIVFGTELVSVFSSKDLREATDICSHSVRDNAYGTHLGVSSIDPGSPSNLTSFKNTDEKLIEAVLQNAQKTAQAQIISQRRFFEALVEHLLSHSFCSRDQLIVLLNEHYKGTPAEKEKICSRTQPLQYEAYGDLWNKFQKQIKAA